MALALNTLCIQLIILGMELERHVVLLLVGHHQIQILATSAPHEGGFAGIECQYIHTNLDLWMTDWAAQLLLTFQSLNSGNPSHKT